MFQSFGQYENARKYQEKALAIGIEIGGDDGEATSYANLGALFVLLGQYDKAKVCLDGSLRIKKGTGDRNTEAIVYGNLTGLFLSISKG